MPTSTRRPRRWIPILAGFSLAMLAAVPAWSLVLPAWVGQGFGADGNLACFPRTTGFVRNMCDIGRFFAVAFPTTVNANHTVRGRVAGNGVAATQCNAWAISGITGGARGTPSAGNTSTTPALITMGTLFVANEDTLQVECWVAPKLPSGASGALVSFGD
jgi:hypothetical protein